MKTFLTYEIKQPRQDYEGPMRADIVRTRRKDFDDCSVDYECHAQNQAAIDLQRTPTDPVNRENTHGRACESNYRIDGLEQQGQAGGNPNLRENLRRKVLDCTHT